MSFPTPIPSAELTAGPKAELKAELKARPAAVLIAALLLLICPPAPQAAISQCRDEAGRMHFLQFGCPPGTREIEPEGDALLSVVTTPPLGPAEIQALDQLERSLARDRQERARERARNARQQATRRDEKARRCREAKGKLEALEQRRRKGYRATAERALEAEEARWRAARKAAC